MEASRLKLADISIDEWSRTDMQHWHEMAQAMSAWRNGQLAGGEMAKDKAEAKRAG